MIIKVKNENGKAVKLNVKQLERGEIEIVRTTARGKQDFDFLLVPEGTAYMMITFDSSVKDPNEGQYGKAMDAISLGEAIDYATDFQPEALDKSTK